MQCFVCGKSFYALKSVLVYYWIVVFLLLTACIQPAPKNPVQVCELVTRSLLGFELPGKIAVSEQEIRGERIVVHLGFKRPADNYPMKAVCVYGVDRYRTQEKGMPYKQVPTRLAINGKQVTENDLVAAINKSGFK